MGRKIRIGIDVGGTHTKAVAIDNDSHEILGKCQVLTTHHAPEGVAKGVVDCFEGCMTKNNLDYKDVIFLAHSTTQATNALLEGDVAEIGIIGIGKGGLQKILVKKQTNISDILLVTGRHIKTHHSYLDSKNLSDDGIAACIKDLLLQGATVIVASQAFGVDDARVESAVREQATEMGIPVTCASDITKLYGLTVRTRTAAINASILPKMLDTANSTQSSVEKTGIVAPLMIMRGDGGVMSIDELRRRPILSMLSGPTASVMGALMYLRASVGVYFEVGGTSTNIGVIKNGRPTIKYASLGNYRTYVNSLDVRVLGVAGGSMVRAANNKIADVGPRSAHIASLDYAAFTPPEEIQEPKLEFICPKEGDPADYVMISCKNGKRLTITNTCAANVLGLVDSQFYSKGYEESCRKAMKPLADYLGITVEETARIILKTSCSKLIPVVEELIEEYKLDEDQSVLVGCGGGAAALIPFMGREMNIKYVIPENADVISSIGVALAMVREAVERIIPNASEEDILAIRQEAIEAAVIAGADPSSVETVVEIDTQTQRVRVTATGSTEVRTTDMMKACTPEEALEIAAASFDVAPSEVKLAGETDTISVFTAAKGKKNAIRMVDGKGFVRLQLANGATAATTCSGVEAVLNRFWSELSEVKSDVAVRPDIFVAIGSRFIEIVGISEIKQAKAILNSEIGGVEPGKAAVVIGTRV